jgi:ubiquinone/menaquinone biosynthesis C-methylase UbiE
MLPRVLEPEVMDSAQEAHDYDAMDHSEVNRAFVVDFLAVWQPPPGKPQVLDVGTGTAQIPIELCRQLTGVTVVAIDAAQHMLKVAKANVAKAKFERRIEVQFCDAKRMPFADGSFAAVISNSIVHHIPQPLGVLGEIGRVVAPGGTIFVRDLLRPADDRKVKQLVATYAGAANEHQQKMFEDSLRAALTLNEVRALVQQLGLDPQAVRQNSDRHWTWCASA